MFGFYTPILILQIICVYHAYRNNAEQRWYWFILLFPLIGCILYLFHHFGNRTTLETLAEGVKGVVSSNYEIERLERDLVHADSLTNRSNLADAYLRIERIDEAIELYQKSLAGFMEDDPVLRMKLIQAYFLKKEYDKVIQYGQLLEHDKSFQQSEERIAYAWALHNTGKTESADKIFSSMDRSFTNYKHRLEYCRFLSLINKAEAMKEKLQEIMREFDTMQAPERRMYKEVIHEFREMNFGIAKA
jgi:hypothetical protein